ncbi:MAG: hypothetical protein KBA03_03255 [Anaerolineaceae bacterium]|nr:hypothetical protein [Anaerolineaceae bacterium]
MQQSSVIITTELLNQAGLPEVLANCYCYTPQGNRLKNELRYYKNDTKAELVEELNAVNALLPLMKENSPQLMEGWTQLARLRELRGTFNSLEHGSLLDETEFFEIKSALTIFKRIGKLSPILEAAGVHFEDTSEAAQLLEPKGRSTPSFHIYSDYSPALAEIRERKKALEHEISQTRGPERKALITKRAVITAEEFKEEEQIRRMLGSKLLNWLPEMQHNAEACGLLDFRLAKADLAMRWNASLPTLVDDDQPTIIENTRLPQLAENLELQGLEFTPISIELRDGTTVLSGANMGGKSVALKAVFLAILMTQLGYFPVCERLETPLYDFLAFESSHDGDMLRGLSSFGLEAIKIRDHYRRSKKERGLIIMDEPCRGTNPAEASVIVQALCQTYGKTTNRFFIATHYPVIPEKGIRFYQVRGIRPEALKEMPAYQVKTHSDFENHDKNVSEGLTKQDQREDIARVRKIQKLMDYRLEEISGTHTVASSAIKIAELLGVDESLIHEMKTAWRED